MALAFAPLSDSIRTKFLRPIVKGRIADRLDKSTYECFGCG